MSGYWEKIEKLICNKCYLFAVKMDNYYGRQCPRCKRIISEIEYTHNIIDSEHWDIVSDMIWRECFEVILI